MNGKQINYVKAVEWFRKAAEQGNDVAQYNLAMCYERGEGDMYAGKDEFFIG